MAYGTRSGDDKLLSLQKQMKDSGWRTASLTSDFAAYGGDQNNTPKYRKIGTVVYLEGIVTPTSTLSGSSQTAIFTLPEGYRPAIPAIYICQGSGANIWLLLVNDFGRVDFTRYRSGSSYNSAGAGTWLPFAVQFVAAD